jgi:hypothetical protein
MRSSAATLLIRVAGASYVAGTSPGGFIQARGAILMVVLATWAPDDAVLAAVAPLALALAAGTALVVDLDPGGPAYPGAGSLAALVRDGPRRVDLAPPRRGVAVLANGGIGAGEAAEVVAALVAGWPAVVLRLPAGEPVTSHPVVPVRVLAPAIVASRPGGPAVYQQGPWRMALPGPGVLLPRPRPGAVRALLTGDRPPAGRWLRAWRQVWERPWRPVEEPAWA